MRLPCPPLATRAEHVHQAVDDLAHVARALVAARLRGRDQGSNERPLLVGRVTWVAKLAPVVASAVLVGPHRQPQSPAAHRSTSRSDRSTCSRTDTEERLIVGSLARLRFDRTSGGEPPAVAAAPQLARSLKSR